MPGLCPVRTTGSQRWLIVPRLIAALPMAVFGSFHLTGMTPMMEILRRASIPFPEVNYYVGPLVMVAAGLSLGFGFHARIGAVLGIGAMLVATYSKVVIDEWPGAMQPPIALPIVVLAACLVVLWKGAGAWSADRRAIERNAMTR
ncbi:MAG: DoxX family protein [Phycisphaerales bacterium]